MAIKPVLARVAHTLERRLEKLRRGSATDNPIIDCYDGYTTADQVILRGRVLANTQAVSASGDQSKWHNFKDFVRLFMTDELRDIEITAIDYDAQTLTDEEGFFTLPVPRKEPVPDIITIKAAKANDTHQVRVHSSAGAPFGVISDIDDTILKTGAYSLIKNLWTSATGNVHQREVFNDAAALMRQLEGQGACFFYVSSSPWNLFGYLRTVFRAAGLPLGPFFLRDLGISRTQFITGTHGDHKTDAIETILSANPDLSFALVGDTGQHDPHIYAEIVRRHPVRIRQVILRRPNTAVLSSQAAADIAAMEAADVPVAMDFDYRALLTEVA